MTPIEENAEMCSHMPNAETIEAIEELEAMKGGEIPERIMTLEEVFGKKVDQKSSSGSS
jgi:hypothetical protein